MKERKPDRYLAEIDSINRNEEDRIIQKEAKRKASIVIVYACGPEPRRSSAVLTHSPRPLHLQGVDGVEQKLQKKMSTDPEAVEQETEDVAHMMARMALQKTMKKYSWAVKAMTVSYGCLPRTDV